MMGSDVLDLDEQPVEVRLWWLERRELFRLAAQSIVDNAASGHVGDPLTLEWAQQVVRNIKPLNRPLTDGVLRCVKCGREGHLSKDCTWPNESQKG